MLRELTDRELENIIYTHFGYVAYKQMAANEKIREFYQLDNEASIDVSDLVKGLVRLINEEKEKTKIKTLNRTLEHIEEYIKDRECNTPELTISCRVMLDGKIKYRARFLMVDTEDNDGTDFVRAEGSSLEEVVGKIAGYLKSGKHYKDGRCL